MSTVPRFKFLDKLLLCLKSKGKFAILLWNSYHFNLVKKKPQVNCNRDLILARGHNNKHKRACLDLNLSDFTSLHFQVVLPALWSLPPSEQQAPLYWIGRNPPGEGFGSSSPCSIVGTHLVNTLLLRLTNITLTPNSCHQENIHQYIQWSVQYLANIQSHWNFTVYYKHIFYYCALLKRIYSSASFKVLGLNGPLNLR